MSKININRKIHFLNKQNLKSHNKNNGDFMNDLNNKINKIKTINNSMDLNIRQLKINNINIALIYLESLSSDDKISDFIGKCVTNIKSGFFYSLFESINNNLPNSKVLEIKFNKIPFYLSNGFTCIIINNCDKYIAIETKANLDRSITESSNEPTLKGPKDSFNENIITNIGLIRKRIKDDNLIFKELYIGRRSKTKIAISYIKDLANINNVKDLEKKFSKINIDGIIDSNYLKELILKENSILPKIISTERPDLVSINLLNGKIAILVDNSPNVLIFPTIFADFFTSPEDYYIKPINASVTRILRYFAFFIAILTPAFYISVVNYNMEIIPLPLLLSFQTQRLDVPFPTIIEIILLLISYEILKEADTRKPQIMGASISIVGALILGDAAVNAGIISPIVVIIISLSAVAGMSFSDINLTNAIRIWRIIFIIFSTFFGFIGMVIAFMFFLAKICSINTFNTPYLYPISPFNFKDIKNYIFKKPQAKNKFRTIIFNKNKKRIGNK